MTIIKAPDHDGVWREKIIPDVGGASVLAQYQFGCSNLEDSLTGFCLIYGAPANYAQALPARLIQDKINVTVPNSGVSSIGPFGRKAGEMIAVFVYKEAPDTGLTPYGGSTPVDNLQLQGVSYTLIDNTLNTFLVQITNKTLADATLALTIFGIDPTQQPKGFSNPSDPMSKGVVSYDGVLKKIALNMSGGDVDTTVSVLVNGVSVQSITMDTSRKVAAMNEPVAESDVIQIEFTSGTAPNWISATVSEESAP